jgi:putative transposase
MSFVKIWAHAVWGTKNRSPLLTSSIHDRVCGHIKENAASKDIYIDSINGHLDHLHCLMLLNVGLSISKQMQLIKGESSNWVNRNKLIRRHFEWADEYYAASVSESNLDHVRLYIQHQQEHHKKHTFQDECAMFLKQFQLMQG